MLLSKLQLTEMQRAEIDEIREATALLLHTADVTLTILLQDV